MSLFINLLFLIYFLDIDIKIFITIVAYILNFINTNFPLICIIYSLIMIIFIIITIILIKLIEKNKIRYEYNSNIKYIFDGLADLNPHIIEIVNLKDQGDHANAQEIYEHQIHAEISRILLYTKKFSYEIRNQVDANVGELIQKNKSIL